MNIDTQLKVQSYLDNELSPGEARKIAGLLSSDREAEELYNHLRSTRQLLRTNEPEVKLADSREFYWSQIRRQIDLAEREPVRSARPLWIRLLAPVLGTAALFALLISVMNPKTVVVDRGGSDILASSDPIHGEVEDLAPDFSSVTFRSEETGATVVWLSARE
jgi:anti-sigma factor RsiW